MARWRLIELQSETAWVDESMRVRLDTFPLLPRRKSSLGQNITDGIELSH